MINAKYSEIEGRKRRERRGGREEVVPKNRSSFPRQLQTISQAVVFLIQKERDTDPPTYFTPKTEVVISARTHTHTHTHHTQHTQRERERER